MDKLGSICFLRTITFKPKEETEIKLINDLKHIVDNPQNLHAEVFVQTNNLQKYGQIFTIKKEDKNYFRFLYET
jgi:hypothetical protein